MSDGQIDFDELKRLWDGAEKGNVPDHPPSFGAMSLGTLRYIVAQFPDKKLHPTIQALLDDPAFSDSVVVEIFGTIWSVDDVG